MLGEVRVSVLTGAGNACNSGAKHYADPIQNSVMTPSDTLSVVRVAFRSELVLRCANAGISTTNSFTHCVHSCKLPSPGQLQMRTEVLHRVNLRHAWPVDLQDRLLTQPRSSYANR